MLEKAMGKLLITSNNHYILLDASIYLGNRKFLGYKLIERKLKWVEDDKIKIYLIIKMIKGDSFKEAANKVFTKKHLADGDYRNITLE